MKALKVAYLVVTYLQNSKLEWSYYTFLRSTLLLCFRKDYATESIVIKVYFLQFLVSTNVYFKAS